MLRKDRSAILMTAGAGAMVLLGLAALWFFWFAPMLAADRASQERHEMDAVGRRVRAALDAAMGELSSHCEDWSAWDAMYEYSRTREETFRKENLAPSSVATLGLSRLELISAEGDVFLRVDIDVSSGQEKSHGGPDATAYTAHLTADGWDAITVGPDDRPAAVSIRSIRTSAGTGPDRGWVVMVKPILPEITDRIIETSGAASVEVWYGADENEPAGASESWLHGRWEVGRSGQDPVYVTAWLDPADIRETAMTRAHWFAQLGLAGALASIVCAAVGVCGVALAQRGGGFDLSVRLRWQPIAATVLVCGGATTAAVLLVASWESERSESSFVRRTKTAQSIVDLECSRALGRANAGAAFVMASEVVTPAEFARFYSSWPVTGGWSACWAVAGWEEDGKFLRVVCAAPDRGDTPIAGLDLGVEPEITDVAWRACDSGVAAATPRGTSLRGRRGASTVVIFAPVYTSGPTPVSLAERRARFRGVVGYELDLASCERTASNETSLEIFIGSAPAENTAALRSKVVPITLADETMWLQVSRVAAAAEGRRSIFAAGVGGAMMTGLCVALVVSVSRRERFARHQVESRTRELRSANASLEEGLRRQSEMTKELALAHTKAEAASRAKSDFLANMSHEIRTPMTAILGYADLLAEGNGAPQQLAEMVTTIRRNGEHLLSVINDILDISKVESGRMTVESIECNPAAVAREAVALMQQRAESKGLLLTLEFNGQIPRRIKSDPTRLKQVLLNLIGNAIKFTEKGSVRLVVRASLSGSDGDPRRPIVRFEVVDTGIGVAPEAIEYLGTPFTQADTSVTRKFGGTGLGLSICKSLLVAMNGGLEVSSKLGSGSVFTARVQSGEIDNADWGDGAADPSPGPATKAVEAAARPTRLSCRVLLAEDSPDNQRLISHHLRRAGADVEIVSDGAMAVDRAIAQLQAGKPFDVILMDMQMPVMDGYTAARALRGRGYRYAIAALTAHTMSDERQKALDAGCDDYLTKPIDVAALLNACERYAGGKLPARGNAAA